MGFRLEGRTEQGPQLGTMLGRLVTRAAAVILVSQIRTGAGIVRPYVLPVDDHLKMVA